MGSCNLHQRPAVTVFAIYATQRVEPVAQPANAWRRRWISAADSRPRRHSCDHRRLLLQMAKGCTVHGCVIWGLTLAMAVYLHAKLSAGCKQGTDIYIGIYIYWHPLIAAHYRQTPDATQLRDTATRSCTAAVCTGHRCTGTSSRAHKTATHLSLVVVIQTKLHASACAHLTRAAAVFRCRL